MEAAIDGKAGEEGMEQELLERLEVRGQVLLERQEMEIADIAWKAMVPAMEAPIAGKAGGEGTEQELLERQGMRRHLLLERQERRNRYSWKGWR